MSSFAKFCSAYGPIQAVPENYAPEVLISDEEFDGIYARRATATNAEKFHARDYVVVQFHQCTRTANTDPDGQKSTQEVFATLPTERLEALFWGLKACTCCWRHCHNKPTEIDSWENKSALDVATEEMVQARDCFCHCRIAKRILRRAYFSEEHLPSDLPDLERLSFEEATQSADSESDEGDV
jgi:hypothetical protein